MLINKKWFIEKNTAVGFGFALSILVGIGVVSYLYFLSFRKPTYWVEHTHSQQEQAIAQTTHFVIFIGSVAAFGLVLIASTLVNRELTERKRVQEELQQSEERFRAIFNSAAVGIAHVDTDGRWLLVNQKLCDIVGYTREELLERTYHHIIHPDDLDADIEYHRQLLAAQIQTYSIEKRYIRKDASNVWINLTVSLVREPSGEPKYFIAVVEDISERKQAESALRQSEQRYRFLADAMPQIVWAARPDGYTYYYNKRWYEFTGLAEGEGGDDSWKPILHPDDVEPCLNRWYGAVKTGEPYEIEYRFINRKTGSYRWHLGRALPMVNQNGEIVEWVGTCTDIDDQKRALEALARAYDDLELRVAERTEQLLIANSACKTEVTERKQAEEALLHTHKFLQTMIDHLPVAVFVKDGKEDSFGAFRLWNKTSEAMFGLTSQQAIGKTVYDYFPKEQADFFYQKDREAFERGTPLDIPEKPIDSKSLGRRIMHIVKAPLYDEDHKPEYLLCILQDITDRKRAEAEIKASLQEKEVLLKEIHHRVKNNLQIIESLLRLQSRYTKDEQAIGMFKESQNRIKSMALIHEKLYQSTELARINFADYIQSLAASLFRSYSINSAAITLKTDVADVFLSVDTAIRCGLLINELVANSLKHAFPQNKKGEIHICLRAEDKHKFMLIVSDNGVGFPKDLDFRNTESLGLQLVTSLAEQLKATIELHSHDGTEFRLTFINVKSVLEK